ncbi:MAG TPA: type II secretion system protein GspN [Thermodesulfobacteriota bacterium]
MTRRARLLTAAGYVALFVAVFYVSLVLAFPVDALRRMLAANVEASTPLTLAIGSLSLGWDGDLSARQVVLGWPRAGRTLPVFAADRVDVDVALLPAAFGRLEARFDGDAYGGRFDGRLAGPRDGPAETVLVALDRLDLARHAGLAGAARVVVAGLLSGELRLSGAAATRRTGYIHLRVESGSVRELPMIAASLPEVGVERATVSARLDRDRLEVESVEVRGPELTLTGSGQIGLREPADASTLNLTFRLRPEQRFPPTLRRLLGVVARAPDASGAFGFVVLGTLARPEVRPL